MYAHIVPKVYQKAWHSSNGKNNVYYFDKKNLAYPLDDQGGNVSKNFGTVNEYIITEEDKRNGLIDDEKAIENFLAHGIENQWSKVVESNIFEWLNNIEHKSGSLTGITAEDLKNTPFERDLLDFVILQQLRIYENFMEFDRGLINSLLKCGYEYCRSHNNSLSEVEFQKVLEDEEFKRTIWKSILINCKEDNDSSFLATIRTKLEENYNLTFVYLKDLIKSKFILSDNPVIWNCSTIKKYEKLESGIFFPITPNCLIMFLNYDNPALKRGDAISIRPNDNFVKYINFCLLNQSRNQIGFMNKSVKDHIEENNYSESDWNTMFE